MKIAINQPTYLPWLGYFDLLDQVDVFVILDNVQFVKQSWQHRNRIRTAAGLQWLTVPVKMHGRFGQLINAVEIRDRGFVRDHLRAIELAYRRSPYFSRYFPEISRHLEPCPATLADLNVSLLTWMARALQIDKPMLAASSLQQTGKRTELLANICTAVGATEYISPAGSATYLIREHQILTRRGIEILFQNYEHPKYHQLYKPFEPLASAIDLLFNEGDRAAEILRSGRNPGHSLKDAADKLSATLPPGPKAVTLCRGAEREDPLLFSRDQPV